MNRVWYRVLRVFEVTAIVVVVLILIVPIQDHPKREHMQWLPTSINRNAEDIPREAA